MSISVDDLVASLSGSHIGQEAMDLAALQAQLAQSLFTQQISTGTNIYYNQRDAGDGQPCNTPMASTPSSNTTFSFGQMGEMSRSQRGTRSRKNSLANDSWQHADDMDEDEQMVEDLLTPSSPIYANGTAPSFAYGKQHTPSRSRSNTTASNHVYHEPSPSPSLFTTTDPFYIAQLQASQNPPQPSNSFFAQAGRPAQQSPFVHNSLHHHQPQYNSYVQHQVPTAAGYQR